MVEIARIKLDKTDRKILSELDRNCRIPSTQLAKIVGKSRQAVDYRIQKLQERGIITGFQAAFNPHKMGYKIYKIYLKLRNIPLRKEELFKYLRSSGIIYWMGEFSGNWDLIFGVFAKGDYAFFELKNELISLFNDIILQEDGAILIDVKQYCKMYFTKEIVPPTEFAGEIINNELDQTDYAILVEIVNNARIPLVELAQVAKCNVSTAHSKLKQLEKKGVIIQYRLGIDLNKLGLELYKAIIKFDRYTKEDETRLLEYMSRLPNIHYFIRNIWEIEPELVVENYQEYYEIIEKLKEAFPQVIKTVDSHLMITDEWTPGFRNLLHVEPSQEEKKRANNTTLED